MRMADLSRCSGLPIATIKFYQREGLLPAGLRTAANQAQYDEMHVRRLRLIAVLTGLSRLGLGAVRDILTAMDDPDVPLARLHGIVTAALLADRPAPPHHGSRAQAVATVDRSLAGRGWTPDRDSDAYAALTDAVAAVQLFVGDADVAMLGPYLDAVQTLAQRRSAALVKQDAEADRTAVVARIVAFGVALEALRVLAEERFLHEDAEHRGG
jgi:DNA-binding transcriptional MerR regulator